MSTSARTFKRHGAAADVEEVDHASESQELRLLRHAFAANPGSESFLPLAEHLCEVGRPEEAEQICRKGLAYMPHNHRGHRVLARALCDRGRLKEAQDVLAELAKVRPEDPDVWVHLAAVVVRRGDRQRARALLDYAETLGASGELFEDTKSLATRRGTGPTHSPVSSLHPSDEGGDPRDDDRPKPVAGVLFSKPVTSPTRAPFPRWRSWPVTLIAITVGAVAGVWMLLHG